MTNKAYLAAKADERKQLTLIEERVKGLERLLLASNPLLLRIKPELLPTLELDKEGTGEY